MITARDGPAMTSTIDISLRLVRAAEFRQRRQRSLLADVIAGEGILTEIVQREIVVVAVGDRRAVA